MLGFDAQRFQGIAGPIYALRDVDITIAAIVIDYRNFVAAAGLNIALDEQGKDWSSADWSAQLQRWMTDYTQINLIIGGPDGLSQQCLQQCQQRVALGRMTMPHALVKVVLLEQLYRAWTIYQGHPYHRE